MYINVGDKLFLPEGDDYSKQEFDRRREELELQGQNILKELRGSVKEAAGVKIGEGKKKLTYKEILEQTAASK
ncbi:MAG: hypothetical protein ACI4LO_01155 [Anaerovoracaceae bacterium]